MMYSVSSRFKYLLVLIFSMTLVSCSAKFLKMDDEGEIANIEEYEEVVQIKDIEPEPKTPPPDPKTPQMKKAPKRSYIQKKTEPKKKAETAPPKKPDKKSVKKAEKEKKPDVRKPKIEDSEGFDGRRPIVDPFRVGEKVTLDIKYFNIKAGQMTIETKPFKEVNGNKSYHFRITVKSDESFNWIYSVEDVAEAYLDYEKMKPYNFAIHVKESKQIKEVRSYFDWDELKGHYWHKKFTEDKGEQTKKYEWDIQPYSQNAFTAPFYLRAFTLKPGKTIKFPMAHDKKNMILEAKILRREKLETKVGTLDTLVIQPKVKIDGLFKPMGKVLFWVTDDDRKLIVRLKSKIKIGTLVGELADLDPGD